MSVQLIPTEVVQQTPEWDMALVRDDNLISLEDCVCKSTIIYLRVAPHLDMHISVFSGSALIWAPPTVNSRSDPIQPTF